MPDYLPEAVRAAVAALRARPWAEMYEDGEISEEEIVRLILDAAAPEFKRRLLRETAREILALDLADRHIERTPARNKGPYGDMQSSLRRLVRGEPLPRPEQLRGGNASA